MSQGSTRPLVVRMLAEFIGVAILMTAIVGSGISAQALVPGPVGLQLLINALATGLVLAAVIWMMMAVSGAHLNPAVTVVHRVAGEVTTLVALAFVAAQVVGALVGAMVANLMFDLPAISVATTTRSGGHLLLSEVVATTALLLLVFALARSGRAAVVPGAVGAFVAGAILFSSSAAFANPAVTIGRMISDTFTGIAPSSVPWFLIAEGIGVAVALFLLPVLYPVKEASS